MAKRKKQVKKKFRKSPKRVDKVKKLVKEDEFLTEDSTVVVEDAYLSHPGEDDVREVAREFDGYRDYLRESRGNGLTFGDY